MTGNDTGNGRVYNGNERGQFFRAARGLILALWGRYPFAFRNHPFLMSRSASAITLPLVRAAGQKGITHQVQPREFIYLSACIKPQQQQHMVDSPEWAHDLKTTNAIIAWNLN